MKTIIERKHKGIGESWRGIPLDEAIHDLESGGYWKKGTVKAMLLEGTVLWTPFAEYRLKRINQSIEGLGDPVSRAVDELRLEIKRHLDKCTPEVMPKVYRRIQTFGGYFTIEERVIRMVIRDRITPGAAIAQIEVEL